MQCYCNKPAQLRRISKAGDNFGKSFFGCPDYPNGCKLFSLVDSGSIPSAVIRNQQNNSQQRNNKVGVASLNLEIAEFTDSPSINAWFRVLCDYSLLIHIFESFPPSQRMFKEGSRVWQFSFDIYDEFLRKFRAECPLVELVPFPQFLSVGIKRYLAGRRSNANESVTLRIEPRLLDILLPYQLDAIHFVIKRNGRAFIGDEMGLGKTIEAIAVLQHYRQFLPALIMVPVTLMNQWNNELLKHCSSFLDEGDVSVIRKVTDPISGKICILPYSMIEKFVEKKLVLPHQFGIVIADESHNLKSKDAKRTDAALPLLKKAQVSLCLSGTPCLNRPVELFTQLCGLLPDIFNDYDAFTRRYCDAKPNRFGPGMDVRGSSNALELKLILDNMVMIRRLKSDVLNTLPQKDREMYYVQPDPAFLPQITELDRRSAAVEKEQKEVGFDSERAAHLRTEQQTLLNARYAVAGQSKVKAVTEWLANLIDKAATERLQAERHDDEENECKRAEALLEQNCGRDLDERDPFFVDLVEVIPRHTTTSTEPYKVVKSTAKKSSHSKEATQISASSTSLRDGSSGVSHKVDPHAVIMVLEDDDGILSPAEENEKSSTKESTISSRRGSNKQSSSSRMDAIAVDADEILVDLSKGDYHDDILRNSSSEGEAKKKEANASDGVSSAKKIGRTPLCRLKKKSLQSVATLEDHESESDLDSLFKVTKKRPTRLSSSSAGSSSRKGIFSLDDNKGDEDDSCVDGDSEDDLDEVFTSSKYRKVARKSRKVVNKKATLRNTQKKKTRANLSDDESFDGAEDVDDDDVFDIYEEHTAAAWKQVFKKSSKDTVAVGKSSKRTKKDNPTDVAVFRGLGKKIIVFGHHQAVLDEIEKFLKEKLVDYVRIDGSVTIPVRNSLVQKFQDDDSTNVAILSVTACGTGLNLTRANVALFAELHWSPGVVLQAEDRIHRIGQKADKVRIIYLVASGTADDIVWKEIQKKHGILGDTVGSTDRNGEYGISSGMIIKNRAPQLSAGALHFVSVPTHSSSSSSSSSGNSNMGSSSSDNMVQMKISSFVAPVVGSSHSSGEVAAQAGLPYCAVGSASLMTSSQPPYGNRTLQNGSASSVAFPPSSSSSSLSWDQQAPPYNQSTSAASSGVYPHGISASSSHENCKNHEGQGHINRSNYPVYPNVVDNAHSYPGRPVTAPIIPLPVGSVAAYPQPFRYAGVLENQSYPGQPATAYNIPVPGALGSTYPKPASYSVPAAPASVPTDSSSVAPTYSLLVQRDSSQQSVSGGGFAYEAPASQVSAYSQAGTDRDCSSASTIGPSNITAATTTAAHMNTTSKNSGDAVGPGRASYPSDVIDLTESALDSHQGSYPVQKGSVNSGDTASVGLGHGITQQRGFLSPPIQQAATVAASSAPSNSVPTSSAQQTARPLSPAVAARIAENRRRALEKLQQSGAIHDLAAGVPMHIVLANKSPQKPSAAINQDTAISTTSTATDTTASGIVAPSMDMRSVALPPEAFRYRVQGQDQGVSMKAVVGFNVHSSLLNGNFDSNHPAPVTVPAASVYPPPHQRPSLHDHNNPSSIAHMARRTPSSLLVSEPEAHIFSTGRGSSVAVSAEAVRDAGHLLNGAVNAATAAAIGPSRKRSVD